MTAVPPTPGSLAERLAAEGYQPDGTPLVRSCGPLVPVAACEHVGTCVATITDAIGEVDALRSVVRQWHRQFEQRGIRQTTVGEAEGAALAFLREEGGS